MDRQELLALGDDAFLAEIWRAVLTTVTPDGPDPYMRHHFQPRIIQQHLIGKKDEPDRKLEERILDAWGTLVSRGLIYEIQSVDHYRLTPAARNVTPEDLGWHVGSDMLKGFELEDWDPVVATYFSLAIRTLEGGVLEAATFLLGGAAERFVQVIREKLGSKISDEAWKKKPKVAERIELLAKLFRDEAKRLDRLDLITVADIFETIGHTNRLARNDVGHPLKAAPRLSRFTVAARIGEFADYVDRLTEAAASLDG